MPVGKRVWWQQDVASGVLSVMGDLCPLTTTDPTPATMVSATGQTMMSADGHTMISA